MTSIERSWVRASLMLLVTASIHCGGSEPADESRQPLSSVQTFFVDGEVTLDSTIPLRQPPAATCPLGKVADLCGSWEGVELVATKSYSPTQSHDAEHCFCRPIGFDIPAFLAVTRGASGSHKSAFTYRDSNTQQMVSCRYDGNGNGKSGDQYQLRSCSNGASAGSHATGDYFTLSIDMGDNQSGTTEVQLRLGQPDPAGVQDFDSTDPRLAGAILHVPHGAAPPYQNFTVSLAEAVAPGTVIGNAGDGATTVGRTVGFTADGVSGTFTFNPTASCARIELPYDAAAQLAASQGVGPAALAVRQVLDPALAVNPTAVSLARLGADLLVDTTNHTVSFCAAHLSFYVGVQPGLNSSVEGVTINGEADRTRLKPDGVYNVILNMKNLGTTNWPVGGNFRLGYRTAAFPIPSPASPWRDGTGNVLDRISTMVAPAAQNETTSFTAQIKAPTLPGTYQFSWCMLQSPSTWFGECYDASITVKGEVCNGVDDDGENGIDDGIVFNPTSCPTGQPGVCADGTRFCVSGSEQCHPNTSPSIEMCDGLDNNCDGQVDEGVKSTFYQDGDGDGHGNAGLSVTVCLQPMGYVTNSDDCNDGSAAAFPGHAEVCDGIDNNCDSNVDEGLLQSFYLDGDHDGHGNPGSSVVACSVPAGYSAVGDDCNDGNASVRPGASEVCDGVDNNCEGNVDENTLNGGVNCGYTANFTNIDDDVSIWTGDFVDFRTPNMKFGLGTTNNVSLCPLFSGCGTQDLLIKIGNGGCFNSGGVIDIFKDGNLVFHHDEAQLVRHCNYIYRVVLRFTPASPIPTTFAENACINDGDCPN